MSNNIEQEVMDFHEKFVPEKIAKSPFDPAINNDETQFRLDFIQEEFDELKDALREENSADELDALVDIMWVVQGTILMRFGAEAGRAAMQAVYDANMTKVRLPGQFKIQKPEGFVPPDIEAVIQRFNNKE